MDITEKLVCLFYLWVILSSSPTWWVLTELSFSLRNETSNNSNEHILISSSLQPPYWHHQNDLLTQLWHLKYGLNVQQHLSFDLILKTENNSLQVPQAQCRWKHPTAHAADADQWLHRPHTLLTQILQTEVFLCKLTLGPSQFVCSFLPYRGAFSSHVSLRYPFAQPYLTETLGIKKDSRKESVLPV